jgi:hypothetical protein
MNALSRYDKRYIERHISEFDEFTDVDSLSAAWRTYIDEKQGKLTHNTRCRIKSSAYDYKRLDAWMRLHRMTNENMAVAYELVYGRRLSVGTVSNIRCGSYTNSKTAQEMMGMIESESDRRTA